MFGFIKKIFGLPTEAEKAAAAAPQRAKSTDGKFVADNPATPANEAWVGGKAPAKKARKPAQKSAPKASQKPAADTKPKKKPAKASKPAA